MKDYTFQHNDKTFQVNISQNENHYRIKVLLDGVQVSPEYSVSLEVRQDFFMQYQESIVAELAKIAEAEVRRGIYLEV